MNKLYYGKIMVDVVFVAEDLTEQNLKYKCLPFLRDEISNSKSYDIQLTELNSIDNLNVNWHHAFPYGQENGDQLTTVEYLDLYSKEETEYKQYLRLKEKFDK